MGDLVTLDRHPGRFPVRPERDTDSGQDPTAHPDVEPLWRETLGRRLRAERFARGERITDVAHRAGVSPQYLSELERGHKDASSEVLSAVAGALALTVSELARRALAAPPVPRRTAPRRSPPGSAGRGSDVLLLAA